ncbi:prepilin peptidase [Secundilactobacillus folii]|uniref:Prepilin peptidase A24 N-terminal domain-containing protein n=1 Tax=Secundilactobacillus folii TaxID=2678357 RepID=A0A7X3C349_9LACO|nr:A24 family peptidase [Secundilactobacillus folii]MTV81884.1 hypothetical protein [Secundilactobacillus folii]
MLILQFILGATLGSFFYASYSRRLVGQSLLTPARSKCDSCDETIEWYHLLPILSYIILHGHCKWCGQRIPKATLLAEIYFACLLVCWQPTLPSTLDLIAGLILFFAAISDNRYMAFPAIYCWLLMMVSAAANLLNGSPNSAIILVVLLWFALQFIDINNRYVGAGDLDILLSLFILHGLNALGWLLLLSSAFALVTSLVIKQRRLAFVPFMALSYLLELGYQILT